jgi:hypothetical protein
MAWKEVTVKGEQFPLPSGGSVEITDDKWVPVGDGFTFRVLTYRDDTTEIVFEVRNGVPGAVSVTLRAGEGFVRQKDLTATKLDDIRADVYAVAGINASIPKGEWHHGYSHYQLDASNTRKVLRKAGSRRKITPELLAKVAEIHNNAPKGTRTSAVVAAFDVDPRTAFRYIARSKQEGLISGND